MELFGPMDSAAVEWDGVDQGAHCLTCDISTETRYFQFNDCLEECVDGYTVSLSIPNDNICKQCDENCLTCVGAVDHCLTCKQGEGDPSYLSLLDNVCYAACPEDTTILTDEVNKICSPCDPTCGTCTGAVDFCTTCPPGYNLYSYTEMDGDQEVAR